MTKLASDWARVVRSPIPRRGQAFVMDGSNFEDGLYRIVVGYDVSPEFVDSMVAGIEDRERLRPEDRRPELHSFRRTTGQE